MSARPAPFFTSFAACERPLPDGMPACLLIHDFLTREECSRLIAEAERKGFDGAEKNYPPSYRDNDRQVGDDDIRARAWSDRLRNRMPGLSRMQVENAETGDDEAWELVGLNERIRTCRYRPGQRFNIHQDGIHHRGRDCRSLLTFMVYLTDGEEFQGGDTLFYAQGPGASKAGLLAPTPVARVRPRAGSLIVFDHGIWHAGEVVSAGVKHIARSDLIYKRTRSAAVARQRPWTGHEGYVWTLAQLAGGHVASGGRDTMIRIWQSDGAPSATLRGHTQSVFGLIEIEAGRLASVSRDKTLRLWDVAAGRCTKTLNAHSSTALALAKIGPETFATGGADGEIALWTSDGEPLWRIQAHDGWAWSMATLEAHYLISAGEDGAIAIWHAATGNLVARLCGKVPLRSIDAIQATDGAWLIATGDIAGQVRVLRFEAGSIGAIRAMAAHDAAVRRVRWLSSTELASCGEDGRFLVSSGEAPLFQYRMPHFATDLIALPDGRLLGCGYDGELMEHPPLESSAVRTA
jgi:hypothetical protein